MAARPSALPCPRLPRSQPISKRMPSTSPSSGAKRGRLLMLSRMAMGTRLLSAESDLRRPRRAHDVEQIENAAVDEREERLRVKAEHQHQHRERQERSD